MSNRGLTESFDETPRRNDKARRQTVNLSLSRSLIFGTPDSEDSQDSVKAEDVKNVSKLDESTKKVEEDGDIIDKEKLLSCLDNYCEKIYQDGRDEEFVDLKGFDIDKCNVSLEDLQEVKQTAEKIVRAEDHTGISNVDLDRAVEAGAMAFANCNIMTRNRHKCLKRRVSDSHILYQPLPYDGRIKKYVENTLSQRENQIVETFVDFKTEVKAKYDVLKRVDELTKLDKLQELPEAKKLRNGRIKSNNVDENLMKTPPNACKLKNPLSYELIMDDFLDQKAEEFIEVNKVAQQRRKTLAKLSQ
ncbi:unnamed protein product [Bursaphelenchus okinawaensis]|uniref:Uncharacterized protein n=1 Tax=Bursaphelenchus okinawaensis TaxID=465554 RepID=A0A811KEW5_9BILA|nr:unnamed protein product [Bursaphelenchus okinawaensis]CAG9101957.1 unnamed protein product [Bursaphelenchus okinawaensis]